MENTQADCTALRPRTVAAIRAEMPEEELLSLIHISEPTRPY